MPTAHRLDARQIGRQGQVSIEVIKEFADSAPGVGERSDVFFAKRRFRGEVLGAIGEPSESIPFSHDTVGQALRPFRRAVQSSIGGVRR